MLVVDCYLTDRALPIWVSLAEGHLELKAVRCCCCANLKEQACAVLLLARRRTPHALTTAHSNCDMTYCLMQVSLGHHPELEAHFGCPRPSWSRQ